MAGPLEGEERRLVLNHAIAAANKDGRLGLILYTIPGFPSTPDYLATLELLNESAAVSAIETTIPVTAGFSEHANEVIRQAHMRAASCPQLASMPRPSKPAICVLYQSTSDTVGFESLLVSTLGQFEGLVLEWSEPEAARYTATARKHGVELVQCVGPWMAPEVIQRVMERCADEPLVYLMSAPMAGGKLFSSEELNECIVEAKKHRPTAKVAAGFGIRTGDDVRRLAEIEALDAVIIGTVFIEAMGEGFEAAKALLENVEPALDR
ncbi:MAG: tryptophan synthase subunit alpha [Gemmatimonadota bacterium]|nr:MAG: tryptophan synthase subunit alpha [Gemmatimonadota bacterium]